MRVSELIKINDIKTWGKGQIITIGAGTGVGKSYWCMNQLYEVAYEQNKKILMLVNRNRIKGQFYMELKKENKLNGTITIMTYQKIERIMLDKEKFINLNEFDYIVCDEFHYFLNDAEFNDYTDLSFSKVINSNAVKIFMSATAKTMLRYIKKSVDIDIISYELPTTPKIKTLNFYNKNNTMYEFAKEIIKNNHKAIFFIYSAKKAYKLYNLYKDNALFYCGKSSEYYKYVDTEAVDKMLIEESFEKNILITTTALDCGISIKDTKLNNIIVNGIFDIDTIIQCIGRKRIVKNDCDLNVYISTFNNNMLGGIKARTNSKIKKAKFFKENGLKEYLLEYPRTMDYEKIIYDVPTDNEDMCTKKLNELMLIKRQIKMCDIELMLLHKNNGYAKHIAFELGFDYKNTCNIEEKNINTQLEYYLENIKNKRLNKEQQKELIEILNIRDSRNRLQKSINILNQYLIENYEMTVVSKRVKENSKLKTVWVVSSLY